MVKLVEILKVESLQSWMIWFRHLIALPWVKFHFFLVNFDLSNQKFRPWPGGGVPKLSGRLKCHISEVSSPTRLWIQVDDPASWSKLQEMRQFYSKQGPNDFNLNQIFRGMRVAAYAFESWDRAEIVSEMNPKTKRLRIFFIDYGTCGVIHIKHCKMLIEQYACLPKLAIRGALYGIKPLNDARLWKLRTTEKFIKEIRNKLLEIEIVRHHALVSYLRIVLRFW